MVPLKSDKIVTGLRDESKETVPDGIVQYRLSQGCASIVNTLKKQNGETRTAQTRQFRYDADHVPFETVDVPAVEYESEAEGDAEVDLGQGTRGEGEDWAPR